MDLMTLATVAAFAPLVGAILAGFLGRKLGRTFAHTVTIALVAVSFSASVGVFMEVLGGKTLTQPLYTWLAGEGWSFHVGFHLDRLTAVMMTVVTFVSLMVHVYTIGYMADDPGYQRFFAYISLFTFSMLMLVMADNFAQLFFGWEAVGLVSYLLIGFWFKRPTAVYANLKAFLVNRVGDFGFLIGIGFIFAAFGTLDYAPVFAKAANFKDTLVTLAPGWEFPLLTVTCIGLFIGAMGKSAQFPLHVWLPDSMEGPTPISALIHAATMVTAGIFLVARMSPLYELAPAALSFIVVIGAITGFFMALVAIVQTDIKRVVAYSTLSQLGYMTMALGCGAYTAAMFHLTTHALFKALLFLCAGSVIHGCHHEQDMFQMGGIRRTMPTTWRTWAIGTLALCGIVPFAGFWSKDEILGAVQHAHGVGGHLLLWIVGTVVAGLTAFYMGRATILTFFGSYRGHAHPHESPKVMTGPLLVLALVSLSIGFIGLPAFGPMLGQPLPEGYHGNWLERWLHAWHVGALAELHLSVALISLGVAFLGLWLAWRTYSRAEPGTDPLPQRLGGMWTTWNNLWYVDRFYLWLVKVVQQGFARLCWLVERWIVIQLLYNGTARLGLRLGERLRLLQGGRLSAYVTSFVLGAVVVAAAVLYAVLA